MKSIISARNISKQYRIGQREAYGTLREHAGERVQRTVQTFERQWARRHGDNLGVARRRFEVDSGEAVGIIGRNGAGKSTLLKVFRASLNRRPAQSICMDASAVCSKSATGFHPELTGSRKHFSQRRDSGNATRGN